ncbi:MAG: BrnT family toxin [Desulfotignum sp.]
MKKLIFEWDDTKNKTNLTKHGVTFEEAQTVFFDESAIQFDDPDHSIDEERFLLFRFQPKV